MKKIKPWHILLFIGGVVAVIYGKGFFLGAAIDIPVILPSSEEECLAQDAFCVTGPCPAQIPTQWGTCFNGNPCCISSWIYAFNEDGSLNSAGNPMKIKFTKSATLRLEFNGVTKINCYEWIEESELPAQKLSYFSDIELTPTEEKQAELYLRTQLQERAKTRQIFCVGILPKGDFHYSSENLFSTIYVRVD